MTVKPTLTAFFWAWRARSCHCTSSSPQELLFYQCRYHLWRRALKKCQCYCESHSTLSASYRVHCGDRCSKDTLTTNPDFCEMQPMFIVANHVEDLHTHLIVLFQQRLWNSLNALYRQLSNYFSFKSPGCLLLFSLVLVTIIHMLASGPYLWVFL